MKKTKPPIKLITGQVMYLGPRIQSVGLGYSQTFRDGIFEHYYDLIESCPSIGALFVPIKDVGRVLRELDFDYSHNMRGKTGRFVTFYNEVQRWLASRSTTNQTAHAGVTLQTKHA
jgi:hypothetical protein